jgi:hypothetical protein
MPEQQSDILIYQAEDGRTKISTRLENETLWLSLNQMVELYRRDKSVISRHIRNILEDGELARDSVVANYATTAADGKTYQVTYYNLEMILAVGYRVRSPRGVQFRQWATERLREYIVKGFTMDDERLKLTDRRADYFDELLARIREIRASEARVYQRIREIFSLASDYVEDQQETQVFFAAMQNKMHFAASGLTAAEIIYRRADASKPNMNLTAFKGSRVLKRDVGTAKNYLDEKEIDTLNRITVMFLDQAEFRAQRRQDIRMKDWEAFLDKFLRDTELPVLDNAGSVSREQALERANAQYDAFAERRRLEAETAADERYIEDLKSTAKALEGKRKTGKKRKGNEL